MMDSQETGRDIVSPQSSVAVTAAIWSEGKWEPLVCTGITNWSKVHTHTFRLRHTTHTDRLEQQVGPLNSDFIVQFMPNRLWPPPSPFLLPPSGLPVQLEKQREEWPQLQCSECVWERESECFYYSVGFKGLQKNRQLCAGMGDSRMEESMCNVFLCTCTCNIMRTRIRF